MMLPVGLMPFANNFRQRVSMASSYRDLMNIRVNMFLPVPNVWRG
jgi:hypothetical protein